MSVLIYFLALEFQSSQLDKKPCCEKEKVNIKESQGSTLCSRAIPTLTKKLKAHIEDMSTNHD